MLVTKLVRQLYEKMNDIDVSRFAYAWLKIVANAEAVAAEKYNKSIFNAVFLFEMPWKTSQMTSESAWPIQISNVPPHG